MRSSLDSCLRRRPIQAVLRLALGGTFVYAAYDKMVHPDQFAEIILDFDLLPLQAVNLAAIWLPVLEALVGLAVIAGIWVRANAAIMSGLMVLFITAIVIVLTRGNAIHCGCFSTTPEGLPRTWLSLWQELVLLLGCLLLWASQHVAADNYRSPSYSQELMP